MSGWNFHNPVRITFGAGSLVELRNLPKGERPLLVTTPGFTRRGVTEEIKRLVGAERLIIYDQVEPNPDRSVVEAAAISLRGERATSIIALGGGSAMDTAKALSVLLSAGDEEFSLQAHLEEGASLPEEPPLPIYAVPTTAGTGAEVTPFATIWDRATEKKYSLTGPSVYPYAAILDPELTLGLPEEETVSSGLDALSQGLESIWNRNANPITVSLASRAVHLALCALPHLLEDPKNIEVRSEMMEASLLSGLAISVTRTALAHSISYPLTAHHGIPHGLACSFTLPALLEYNVVVDDGRLSTLAAGLRLGGWVEFRRVLQELLVGLQVPERLSRYLDDPASTLRLVPEMFTPGRADNNLRSVGSSEIEDILTMAWGDLGLLQGQRDVEWA